MTYSDFIDITKNNPKIVKRVSDVINSPVLDEKRKTKRKIYIPAFIIYAGGLLAASIYFFIQAGNPDIAEGANKRFLSIAITCLVVSIIPFVIMLFKSLKKPQQPYRIALTEKMVKAIYGDYATYDPHGGFSTEFLKQLKLFDVDGTNQEDLIFGVYKNVQCTIADVITKHVSKKMNYSQTTFNGMILKLQLNKPAKSEMRILFEPAKESDTKLELDDFNSLFRVVCDTPKHIFYTITYQMQMALVEIYQQLNRPINIFICNDLMVIALSNIKTEVENVNTKFSDNKNANIIMDQLLPAAYLIEELNLDHQIFVSVSDENSYGEE